MLQNIGGIMRDLDKERRDYDARCNAIRSAADSLKAQEIARVASRFEFESDEFMSAEEKAEWFIQTGVISARY